MFFGFLLFVNCCVAQLDSDTVLQTYIKESEKINEKYRDFIEKHLISENKSLPASEYPDEKATRDLLLNDSRESFKKIFGADDYLTIMKNKSSLVALHSGSWTAIQSRVSKNITSQLACFYDSSISFQRWKIISANTSYENDELNNVLPIWIWDGFIRYYENSSWIPMNIYSFREDARAKELLFELYVNDIFCNGINWSGVYLTFIDSPEEMLNESNSQLNQQIEKLRALSPTICSFLEKELPRLNDYSDFRFKQKLKTPLSKEETEQVKRIMRLKILTEALTFHASIPKNEYRRYVIFLRELMISHALSRKIISSRFHPDWFGNMKANLKTGDEQFRIYALQTFRVLCNYRNNSLGKPPETYKIDVTYECSESEALSFFEKELAQPRFNYTTRQKAQIYYEIKKLQYNIKHNVRQIE